MKTNIQELAAAVEQLESLGDDVAWSVGTITNDRHAMFPIGRGYSVSINFPNSEKAVFEKAKTLREAVSRALTRC